MRILSTCRILVAMASLTVDPFADALPAVPALATDSQSIASQVEAALIDAALGGTSWKEIPLAGELVRAEQYRAPDVAAAKALLAAHAPDRYGQQAGQAMPPIVVITDPAQLRAIKASQASQSMANVIEAEKITAIEQS